MFPECCASVCATRTNIVSTIDVKNVPGKIKNVKKSEICGKNNKKFELMLTRCAKAYSSSISVV